MKILAVSHNTADPTPHIADELRRTSELQSAGVIEQVYLKSDRSGAVMILEAPSAGDAERELASLPLVQHRVTQFTVTELMTLDEVAPMSPAS
jgi:muconolactone delta-isomerase